VEGFFRAIRYSKQTISQRVTLLFFFAEKKKRSKKRKEFAFPLYCEIQVSPENYTGNNLFRLTKIPRRGDRRLVRRNTTLFTLKIGA
jgi:hypothetical protein